MEDKFSDTHLQLPTNFFCVAPSPDTYIQKTKKSYIDSRARRNLGSINTELQDVQRIMVANIEEVLQRGEALAGKSHTRTCLFILIYFVHFCLPPSSFSFFTFLICFFVLFFHLLFLFLWFLLTTELDYKASNLSSQSKKYRSDAKYLNTRSTYAKLAAGGVFFIMFIVYVRFWWL